MSEERVSGSADDLLAAHDAALIQATLGAAAKAVCGYCNPDVMLNLAGRFSDATHQFHVDATGSKYECHAFKLRALAAPDVARWQAEQEARIRLEEADWFVLHASGCGDIDGCPEVLERIAAHAVRALSDSKGRAGQ